MADLILQFDGDTVAAVYDDALAETLDAIGAVHVRRASHVEPVADGIGWTADMAPMDGPLLGPFPTRAAALDAERTWLRAHVGL